jgi:pyruvate, orthophosphate dikinase
MIMAEDGAGRAKALAKIEPMQRQDFVELFQIMDGLPVTIRLLDPPLHEFLPHQDHEVAELAKMTGKDPQTVRARVARLHEVNPMLGHRGCRLAVTYPEIYEMQARAIFKAAVEVGKSAGKSVYPEIMIPLVATKAELDLMRDMIAKVYDEVRQQTGVDVEYSLGTMIELPRAALRAGEIAETAEFFSFGTNDLTQTTYGLSRDDASNFLEAYEKKKIIEVDPFVSLDQAGVGELVKIACERGRATRGDIKLGICGEHGGDPASIRFCNGVGLDYVSCSPYRVPIARLAAAQAALAEPAKGAAAKISNRSGDDRHRRVLISSGRRSAAKRIAPAHASARLPVARPATKKAAKKPIKKAPPKPPKRPSRGGKKGSKKKR